MSKNNIAFDASARTFDKDGRMHISRSHISKAGVNPYFGSEIPGYASLGLDPQKIYYMLRSPEELAKAAPTFARNPILSRHIPVSAETPQQHLIVGAIGSEVEFNAPYLDSDLSFWTDGAIAGIESEQLRELSAAYHYVPLMTPGTYEGAHYDGIMTEIHGNHLATVESGRAGSDVLAADSNPWFKRISEMEWTKLGKALFAALCAASPTLAKDAALSALVGKADKKSFDKAKVTASVIAMDAALSPETLTPLLDSILAFDEKEEKPTDEAVCDEDETEEEREKKRKTAEDGRKAMDAAIATGIASAVAGLKDADEARRLVRPVVGDVIAQDSADGIYEFALDHLKVDHKDIKGHALKRLFEVASSAQPAPAPRMALDSATLAQFPGLARIRVV